MRNGDEPTRPLSVKLSRAAYAGLTAVLVRSMRSQFGTEPVETFVDLCVDAHAGRGVIGVARLWSKALPQIIRVAVAERREKAADAAIPGVEAARASRVGIALQDVKFGIRALRSRPGFTLTVVSILALGVGAATAIFSVVDGLVLKDLAVPEPDRLVFFEQGQHTVPEFESWRRSVSGIDPLVGIWPGEADLTGSGVPDRVAVAGVTSGYFDLLGVAAHRGRLFDASDMVGPRPVVVLSYGLWMSRFAGADSVIGGTIRVNGEAREIVGVTGPDFRPPMRLNSGPVQVWRPADTTLPALQESQSTYLRVFGRLREGTSLEVAQQQVDAAVATVVARFPDAYTIYGQRGRFVPLTSLHAAEVIDLRAPLLTLLGAVCLLLIVACATVASLVSARLRERSSEIRIRLALGSPRGRIIWQLLSESLVLSLAGGVVGLGIAAAGIPAFIGALPVEMPGIAPPAIDGRVFAFTLVVSVAVAVIFGLAPALMSSGHGLVTARRGLEASSAAIRRFGRGLVTVEMALCFVLLAGAGLLVGSFRVLLRIDPGFEPDRVLAFEVGLGSRYALPEERDRFRREVVARLAALPEVETAGMGLVVPFSSLGSCCRFGRVLRPDGSDSVNVTLHPVSGTFFTTIGARLIEGDAVPDDPPPGPLPIVLTRATADRLFPRGDAVGRTVALRVDGGFEARVVGLVEDIPFYSLERAPPTAFVPFHPIGSINRRQTFAVRLRDGAVGQGDALRRTVWAVDPDIPVPVIMALTDRVDLSLFESRVMAVAFAAFASFALVLALGATWGTVAYVVSRRRHELGIRLALGADPGRLMRFVVAGEARAAVIGMVLGLIGARLLSGVLAAEVYGISPGDPGVFASVTLGLGVAVFLATWLPARAVTRSTRLRDTLDATG